MTTPRFCSHCGAGEGNNTLALQCEDRDACNRRIAAAERAKHETGPWAGREEPEHCGDVIGCSKAGIWGATGKMPDGHVWYWRNREHTSGYLAHKPGPGPGEHDRIRQLASYTLLPDWTTENGKSNSSPEYIRLATVIADLLHAQFHVLNPALVDQAAGLIMAQLAHEHHVLPFSAIYPEEGPARDGTHDPDDPAHGD